MQTLRLIASALAVATAFGVQAQDTTAPAPETPPASATENPNVNAAPVSELPLGETVQDPNAPGTIYIRELSEDWQIRCVRVEEGQTEPCNLYQLLQDEAGNNVAEITIFALPAGGKAAAGARIITPLGTDLSKQLTLSVDGGGAKRYPFSFCETIGCVAQIGMTNDDVNSFRRGAAGKLTITPFGAPQNVTVDLSVSLSGFTKGFEALRPAAQ